MKKYFFAILAIFTGCSLSTNGPSEVVTHSWEACVFGGLLEGKFIVIKGAVSDTIRLKNGCKSVGTYEDSTLYLSELTIAKTGSNGRFLVMDGKDTLKMGDVGYLTFDEYNLK
jgi:hypothetical protein